MGSRGSRLTLLQAFSVVSLVVTAALGVALGAILHARVERRALDDTKRLAVAVDPSDAAIVRSTIDLARHLGLDVVAEGVETEEVLDGLVALECDVAQGFLLSRPLPADELDAWLATRA